VAHWINAEIAGDAEKNGSLSAFFFPLVFGGRSVYGSLAGTPCWLWQEDVSTCEMVLEELVREGFLHGTSNGAYIAARTA
jgi:hypothetical protein